MTYFDQFRSSNDSVIQQAANMLEDATARYQAGTLAKNEFTELSNDILDFQHIAANISDMVRQQAIYEAFQQLSTIVSTILSL